MRKTGRIRAIVESARRRVEEIEKAVANLKGAVRTLAEKMSEPRRTGHGPGTGSGEVLTPVLPGDFEPSPQTPAASSEGGK